MSVGRSGALRVGPEGGEEAGTHGWPGGLCLCPGMKERGGEAAG